VSKLKRALSENRLSFGSWITLGHPSVAEVMAGRGFDWLTIDMEHSAITLSEAQILVQTLSGTSCEILVRVGVNDSTAIKRVMDLGVHGVIVPNVNSADDARKAVAAVKYPPSGTRGVGLARAQGYGFSFDEYKNWLAEEAVVIVQIEHIDAVEALEEILAVPGVDGTIIGPYDLSGSVGHPGDFDRSEVREALERYEETSKRMGVPMGFHVVQPDVDAAADRISKGYTFVAVGLDTLYLGTKCDEVLSAVRNCIEVQSQS